MPQSLVSLMARFVMLNSMVNCLMLLLLIDLFLLTPASDVETQAERCELGNLDPTSLLNCDLSGEKQHFKVEIGRLIQSIYTDRSIFVRELLSNAGDALDRIKYIPLSDKEYPGEKRDLDIRVRIYKESRTLSITDSGIGMTKKELTENLGTVGISGVSMVHPVVGKFGVGFYSAFLVADEVMVASKSNNDPDQHVWRSKADGLFSVTKDSRGNTLGRGTSVILKLKEDADEFLESSEFERLVTRFSLEKKASNQSFVPYPIFIWDKKVEFQEVPIEKDKCGEDEKDKCAEDEKDKQNETPKTKTVEKTIYFWKRVLVDSNVVPPNVFREPPPVAYTPQMTLDSMSKDIFVEFWGYQSFSLYNISRVLIQGHTGLQEYLIFETHEASHNFTNRYLALDGSLQFSNEYEYVYHELMSHPVVNLFGNSPIKILILGGGDGGIVTQVFKHSNVISVQHVDIDPKIPELSKKYFPEMCKGFDDPRYSFTSQDAKVFLQETSEKFDIIIIDFTDIPVSENGFWTNQFYEDLFGVLEKDGIYVINVGCWWEMDAYDSGWDVLIKQKIQFDLPHLFSRLKFVPIRLSNPDYKVYGGLMIMNNKNRDPLLVDWNSFYKKNISTKYYNEHIHNAMIETEKSYNKPHLITLAIDYNIRVSECKKSLKNNPKLNQMLDNLIELFSMHELDRISHVFPNGGYTVISMLKESHIAIHTWPEHSSMVIDILSCNLVYGPIDFESVIANPFGCFIKIKTIRQ